MAEEDIYGSKRVYERRFESRQMLLAAPSGAVGKGARKYYCQNPENLRFFEALHRDLESRDLSYIRRNRLFDTLLFAMHHTAKGLERCERDDINEIVARAHEVNRSVDSKESFVGNLKRIWKILFPDTDERGRPDERLTPYVVRHLTRGVDKSQRRMKNDRLTVEEYKRLVAYFASNELMQAYICIAVESLGRPQEMLFRRIKDVELHENYARIWVSSHGKEGTKFLQCIDSYPYLLRWYGHHPYQHDPEAFLFFSRGESGRCLTPAGINKALKLACKRLGIDKRITAYSLKRNGVTFRRLRGDSDLEIQHVASWTSTKQLQTYDLSTANDSFKGALARRGLGGEDGTESFDAEPRSCPCGHLVGFADKLCPVCKRSTDARPAEGENHAARQIKDIFDVAMKDPSRTFAEILSEFRQAKLLETS